MKKIIFILWLIPVAAVANPLSHSKWEDESASQCPTAIYFGVKKYIFINRCYSPRKDGVVERGIYAVSGDNLMLSNRQIISTKQFELIPRDLNQVRIQSLTTERLLLELGGNTKGFRRLLPGLANQPRKQAISYSTSIVDTAKIPAHSF